MADNAFENPRSSLYDHLEGARGDLEVYLAIADELGARRVLDVGCGTGTFALMLATCGLAVTGVDPAHASLEVARAKTGAERVRWIHSEATTLPVVDMDLAVMTGNVAQAIVAPSDWDATLRGIYQSLRPGGYLVFETRDPAREAWKEWNRPASFRVTNVPEIGAVESWYELVDVSMPLVSFRETVVFPDAAVLTSDSTLRFRERDEVEDELRAAGYTVVEVRAPWIGLDENLSFSRVAQIRQAERCELLLRVLRRMALSTATLADPTLARPIEIVRRVELLDRPIQVGQVQNAVTSDSAPQQERLLEVGHRRCALFAWQDESGGCALLVELQTSQQASRSEVGRPV